MSYDKKLYNQIKKYSAEGAEKYKEVAMKEHKEGKKKSVLKEDPIAAAHKKASVSPKKMFKDSMSHLKKTFI